MDLAGVAGAGDGLGSDGDAHGDASDYGTDSGSDFELFTDEDEDFDGASSVEGKADNDVGTADASSPVFSEALYNAAMEANARSADRHHSSDTGSGSGSGSDGMAKTRAVLSFTSSPGGGARADDHAGGPEEATANDAGPGSMESDGSADVGFYPDDGRA